MARTTRSRQRTPGQPPLVLARLRPRRGSAPATSVVQPSSYLQFLPARPRPPLLRRRPARRAGRGPWPGRPPPDQGADRRRAAPGSLRPGGALRVAGLLADKGDRRLRREPARGQVAEEAPGDDGRGEEGGIGAHDRLLGRTEEEGPREVGSSSHPCRLPAPVLDAALGNGGPVPADRHPDRHQVN